MKLTINTVSLQALVAKAMKGASCNKMLPLTNMMAIQLKDNALTLVTTDATNYLYVEQDKVLGEDFYVVVQTDIFSKLVSKLTCENVTMVLDGSALTVKGNGSYKIELPLDEEGELIKFPDPLNKPFTPTEEAELHLSTAKLILGTAKAALSKDADGSCYTGYYMGQRVVATDTFVMCGIKIPIFEQPVLLAPETLDLLGVFGEEKIAVAHDGDTIIFTTPTCSVYGKCMDCLGDFQIDVIQELLDDTYESVCKIAKGELLQLLDRLSLFVGQYDKNSIYLTFTQDGVQVDSKQANSSELIPYVSSSGFKPFRCCVDIEVLTQQVKASSADQFELHYGKDNAVKLVDGNVTQVVALTEEE